MLNTSVPPSSARCKRCFRTALSTIGATSRCVKEGLELAQGPVVGELPPALLPITEHGMQLLVDIQGGHKTGYYLDQRDSRLATRRYVTDKRVLNCFSYTGGFAVSALMGAAEVISVDTSQEALDVAKQNVELNKLDLSRAEFVRDDVFKLLRKYRDQGRSLTLSSWIRRSSSRIKPADGRLPRL